MAGAFAVFTITLALGIGSVRDCEVIVVVGLEEDATEVDLTATLLVREARAVVEVVEVVVFVVVVIFGATFAVVVCMEDEEFDRVEEGTFVSGCLVAGFTLLVVTVLCLAATGIFFGSL